MPKEKEESGWFSGWFSWGGNAQEEEHNQAEDKLLVQQAFEELHQENIQQRIHAYQKKISDHAPVDAHNGESRAAQYKAEAANEAKGVLTDKNQDTNGGFLSGIWGLLGGNKVAEVSPVKQRMEHVQKAAANLGEVHKKIAEQRQQKPEYKYAKPGKEYEKQIIEGKVTWAEKAEPPRPAAEVGAKDPKETLPEPKKFAESKFASAREAIAAKLNKGSHVESIKASADSQNQDIKL